jgi:hypothetical protein
LHGLREELNAIIPYLEDMRTRKVERWNQFVHVLEEIKKISSEIRPSDFVPFKTPVDQSDLSLRKLEELTKELESLQKEKVTMIPANLLLSPLIISPSTAVHFFVQ